MIGTGYVGLTTGVCFAELGHSVTCLDSNEEKIAQLKNGGCPIFEAGLEDLLKKNIAAGRLSFTAEYAVAIPGADIVFICVDTPPGEYGKANLTNLLAATRECAQHLDGYTLIINKSTAPVGTVKTIKEVIGEIAIGKEFDVASNPEFLAEGTAINDFMELSRIIVRTDTPKASATLKACYASLIEKGYPYIETIPQSSELIKYASKSFLDMKLSFINEIADFCEIIGADVKEVAYGMGLDSRIGGKFLQAGIGYGGSCFGKDVQALAMKGEELGYEFRMIKALIAVNSLRYRVALNKLLKNLGTLKNKKIGVLGLAYKANTDDVRDAQSLRVVLELLDAGARVTAYDPEAIGSFKKMFKRSNEVIFATNVLEAVTGADAILILTEWSEFKALNITDIKTTMSGTLIVDGRNILMRKTVEAAGFTYEGIGR